MERDSLLELRMKQIKGRLRVWSCMLGSLIHDPVNEMERWRSKKMLQAIDHVIPPRTWQKIGRVSAPAAAVSWKLRMKLMGDVIQPSTIVTHYKADGRVPMRRPAAVVPITEAKTKSSLDVAAAASML
ncbi:MAG: hypothetical protein JRG91_18995 [Deltaproteobacteria bacterium]|nr:hypothetical protein [Deltaproteobacteria bacterium]